MPGLVGYIRPTGAPLSSVAETLTADHPSVSWRILVDTPTLVLAVDSGSSDRTYHASEANDGMDYLVLWGHCIDTKDRQALDADQLLQRLQSTGLDSLDRLEGGFQFVWRQQKTNSIHLINDRLGALPCYLHKTNEGVSFAHRPRFLSPCLETKTPDPSGVISFLSIGYCLGSRSLVKGVEVLLPATVFTVDMVSGQLQTHQYWDLKYQADPSASVADLTRELHEAIVDSVDLLAPESETGVGLFLSGGWDCRAILGAQMSLGRPPAGVVTNGKSDTVPDSDTAFAKKLAADLGLDYRLCLRDPELSSRLFRQGIQKCELVTDTAPEVFGQLDPPQGTFAGLNSVFKGDEIWGWQDEALNPEQAVANVMPTNVSDGLLGILDSHVQTSARQRFQSEIDAVLEPYGSGSWNEIKDYLYLKGRVTRYILGLGSSDEEHIQVRRPFFTRSVIDVVQKIKDHWRVQKNLYLEMLAQHQSALFRYRRNHASHIANYYAYMSESVNDSAELFRTGACALHDVLDVDKTAAVLSAFHVEHDVDDLDRPSFKMRLRNNAMDRWGYRWYRSGLYRQRARRQTGAWSASDTSVAFRVFLLTHYFSQGFSEEA